MKRLVVIISFFVTFSCNKENSFFTLSRSNPNDLKNPNVVISDLVSFNDFHVVSASSNRISCDFEYEITNSALAAVEVGVCANLSGNPTINDIVNLSTVGPYDLSNLEMTRAYFLRPFIKVNNTTLDEGDVKKYTILYGSELSQITRWETCYSFQSADLFQNSGWISNNFSTTSNPNDNRIWSTETTAGVSISLFNIPSNLKLNFGYGVYGGNSNALNTGQIVQVFINGSNVANLNSNNYAFITLPAGNVLIEIKVNSYSLYLEDICIQ